MNGIIQKKKLFKTALTPFLNFLHCEMTAVSPFQHCLLVNVKRNKPSPHAHIWCLLFHQSSKMGRRKRDVSVSVRGEKWRKENLTKPESCQIWNWLKEFCVTKHFSKTYQSATLFINQPVMTGVSTHFLHTQLLLHLAVPLIWKEFQTLDDHTEPFWHHGKEYLDHKDLKECKLEFQVV